MASQKAFVVVSVLLSFIFIVRLSLWVVTDDVSAIELLNWGTLVYMSFLISYLYPQFKDNDERTKAIKQKGMFYSTYIMLVILIILTILMQFNMITLTAIELIRILISVIILAFWTSWFFLSKRM